MRGLLLNSPGVQQQLSSFVPTDTLEFLARNGKSRGQTPAMPVSNHRRVPHNNIVSRQRLSWRSKKFDPLCTKTKFPQCSVKRISYCRAYGSPPDVPVREEADAQEDGEADDDEEEKPEAVVAETAAEASPPDVVASITSWGTLPPRFKLILTTALAFVICNMDKVSRPAPCLQLPWCYCSCTVVLVWIRWKIISK